MLYTCPFLVCREVHRHLTQRRDEQVGPDILNVGPCRDCHEHEDVAEDGEETDHGAQDQHPVVPGCPDDLHSHGYN